MASQTSLTPSATHFILVVQGNAVDTSNPNTCTYTLEYSTDGITWHTYNTYTDAVNYLTQSDFNDAPVSGSGVGGEQGRLPVQKY